MSEPQLSADFAARVLEAADRFAARRRRARRLTGTSAVCLGMIATAVWLGVAGMPNDRKPAEMLDAAVPLPQAPDASVSRPAAPRPPDALSYFFPDADALSRYAAEDAGDASASSAGTLLADDE